MREEGKKEKKRKSVAWSIERTGIRLSVYTVERPDQEPWIIHRESETRCFSFGARTDVVPCLFALLVDSLLYPTLLVLGYFWHPVSACLSASCFSLQAVQRCMYMGFFLVQGKKKKESRREKLPSVSSMQKFIDSSSEYSMSEEATITRKTIVDVLKLLLSTFEFRDWDVKTLTWLWVCIFLYNAHILQC